MCKACLEYIIKAEIDDFLDSLDLTNAERAVLEELFNNGEQDIIDILEAQGKELDDAIQELSEELLVDENELYKVILDVQAGDFFQSKFEQAVYDAFMPLFYLAGESELTAYNPDKTWSVKNTAAAKFSKKLKKLVPDMNKHSAEVMLNAFKHAIERGDTPSERAQLVQEVSAQAAKGEAGPFTMQRAMRISRTMSTAAANGGKLEGWKQSDVVTKKLWRSANQSRTRKSHKKANGQEKPLDEPFEVGDDELMHPGDPNGSAKEIVNCRCTMQAVMD
jgi:hypothetical protein